MKAKEPAEIQAIFDRMQKKPVTVADYRLSLRTDEMARIPAGRTWIERWIPADKR